jgi:uncharacterized membrane protein
MKYKAVLFIFLGILFLIGSVYALEYDVSVSITPKVKTLAPSEHFVFDVKVMNSGENEDTFSLEVTGLPEGWYTLSEDSVTLDVGEESLIWLFVTPYWEDELGSFEVTVSTKGQSEDTDTFTLEVTADRMIEVTIPEEITTCLQEETDVVVAVKNTGEHTEDIKLTVSGDASDFVELDVSSFTLEAGKEKDVTLTVKPADIEVGDYSLELKAESETSYAFSTASSTIKIIECYEVGVTYTEELMVCKGVSEDFTITIKNIGLKKDSYELSIEELKYTESVDLEAEESESFKISFLEDEIGSYEVDFVVESEFTKEEGTIKFEVVKCYGIDLIISDEEFEIEMGKGKLIKIEVKNTGTKADVFDITSDIDWVSIKPSTLELTPDESKFVYVYYSPKFGLKGTFNTTLTSKSDSSQDTEKLVIKVVEEAAETIQTTIEETTVEETVETTVEEEETTIEETTIEEEETTVETTEPEIPEIPTGEVVDVMGTIWSNRLLRSLLIAIIVVLIILIVIYLVVMR